MVLPERVFVTVGLFGDTQSLQRFLMSVCFEMVDHTAADYAIDKATDLFGTTAVVGDEMQMLEHNDVSEDEKFARTPSFVYGVTRDFSNRFCTKNRQAVFGNRGQVISERVF